MGFSSRSLHQRRGIATGDGNLTRAISGDTLALKLSESLAARLPARAARDFRLPRVPHQVLAVVGVSRGGKTSFLERHIADRLATGDPPGTHLLVSTASDALALGHWLYSRWQSDVTSMAEASREFRARLGLGSFMVVAARGMVSAANLQALQDEGIEYVIRKPLSRSTANEGLARAGWYKRVSRHLKTDGTERVLVCRNRERAIAITPPAPPSHDKPETRADAPRRIGSRLRRVRW